MSLPHQNNFNKRSIDSISHTGNNSTSKKWNNNENTKQHTSIQTLNDLKNTLHLNLKALGLNILRQNSSSPSLHSSQVKNRNNTSNSNINSNSGSYNSSRANTITTNKRQKLNINLPLVVAPIHVMATVQRCSSVPANLSRVSPSAVLLRPSPCTSTTYKRTLSSSLKKKKKSTPSRNIVKVDSSFSIEQALFFEPFLLSPSLFSHLIQQGDVKSN